MTAPALCGAAERRRVFREKRAGCLSTAAGGRVPARAGKTVCERAAEGQAAGRGSFGTFLAAKKSTRISKKVFRQFYTGLPGQAG